MAKRHEKFLLFYKSRFYPIISIHNSANRVTIQRHCDGKIAPRIVGAVEEPI